MPLDARAADATLSILRLADLHVGAEPPDDAPFPQADDLGKVLFLVEHLAQNPTQHTAEHLEAKLEVVKRQVSYYTDAGRWLGFVQMYSCERWRATSAGRDFLALRGRARTLALAAAVLSSPVFRTAARDWAHAGGRHDRARIDALIQEDAGAARLNPTTANRRATSVMSWINALAGAIESDGVDIPKGAVNHLSMNEEASGSRSGG